MSKHIVTGIKPYDFVDDNGQRLQGVKLYYLDNHQENEPNMKGFFPLNLSLTGDHAAKFTEVPGIYDLDFRQTSDKYGKPVLKLRDASFVSSVKLPVV